MAPQPCPLCRGNLYGLPSAPWAHPLRCGACVHFSHLTRSALCVAVLVCTCLGSLGLLSVLQACVHLSWLPRPALCVAGLVRSSFGSLGCPLCHEACVHWRGLYAVTLWAPGPALWMKYFREEKGMTLSGVGKGEGFLLFNLCFAQV